MGEAISDRSFEDDDMLLIGIALLVVLVVAGLVTVYVAFAHQGEPIPHAGWLSDAMIKVSAKVNEKLKL